MLDGTKMVASGYSNEWCLADTVGGAGQTARPMTHAPEVSKCLAPRSSALVGVEVSDGGGLPRE